MTALVRVLTMVNTGNNDQKINFGNLGRKINFGKLGRKKIIGICKPEKKHRYFKPEQGATKRSLVRVDKGNISVKSENKNRIYFFSPEKKRLSNITGTTSGINEMS